MPYISPPSIPLPPKVHVEQELLIYEAFPYDQQQPQNNLKVRFKKVSLSQKLKKKKKLLFEFCVQVKRILTRSAPFRSGTPQHQLQREEIKA